MPQPSTIDQIADRIERLLEQQALLRQDKARLEEQLAALTAERDSLRSRLQDARARVDALLDRLPANATPQDAAP